MELMLPDMELMLPDMELMHILVNIRNSQPPPFLYSSSVSNQLLKIETIN